MRVVTYRCDSCDRVLEEHEVIFVEITVMRSESEHCVEVCSPKCLTDWVTNNTSGVS